MASSGGLGALDIYRPGLRGIGSGHRLPGGAEGRSASHVGRVVRTTLGPGMGHYRACVPGLFPVESNSDPCRETAAVKLAVGI